MAKGGFRGGMPGGKPSFFGFKKHRKRLSPFYLFYEDILSHPLGKRRKGGTACGGLGIPDPVGVGGGRCAAAGGVGEYVHRKKTRALGKCHCLCKVFFAFPGETHDHIAGQLYRRDGGTQGKDRLDRLLGVIAALHPCQHL